MIPHEFEPYRIPIILMGVVLAGSFVCYSYLIYRWFGRKWKMNPEVTNCLSYDLGWDLGRFKDVEDNEFYSLTLPVKPDTTPEQALEAMILVARHILATQNLEELQ